MKIALLILALQVVCALPVRADDTIEALAAQALARNPGLEAALRKWEAALARARGESSLPDPMVGADWERDSTRLGDRTDIEYMVQQDLPGWGKRRARTSAARLFAEAEGFRYLESARALRGEVAQAWWELWARTRSVEAMAGNLETMGHMEQAALARYEAGTGQLSDVLRAQAALARMSNDLVTMQREVAVARSGLNRLVNDPPDTARALPAEPPDPVLPTSLDDLQRQGRQFCCILRAQLREVEAKAAAVQAARAEQRPDWQVRVEGRQPDGRNSIEEVDTGVFLNFPWLWRGKYVAGIRDAEAARAAAEAEYQDELNKTQWEIRELFTRAGAAQRQARTLRETILPRLREATDSSLSSYQSGQGSYLDVLDSVRSRRESELEYYRARAQFGQAVAQLDTITAPWGDAERPGGLTAPDKP